MAVSDPIADMLTKIRNASQAKHEKVDISTSKMKLQIIKIIIIPIGNALIILTL